MDTLNCIMTRRSVRKYTDQILDYAVVDTILKAGANAPSAGNQQPWHFMVVMDKTVLQSMSDALLYGKMLPSATCAIVVCLGGAVKWEEYAPQDCAAATQNILLAAHALGVGATWLGVYPDEKRVSDLSAILGTPSDIKPFAVVSLGYPASAPEPMERLQPHMVHVDRW